MKYIRLNNSNEFYKNDLPARFLGNISDLNIIIGANNTRKSRFLRTIINQEFNILLEGHSELNSLYESSLTMFEELNKIGNGTMEEKYLQFHFLPRTDDDIVYTNIKTYFDSNNQVDFFQFRNTINNINDSIRDLSIASHFTAMQAIANSAFYTVELFLWVYDILNKGIPHASPLQDTHIDKIRWKHNLSGNSWPDFDLKFDLLKRMHSYLKVIINLKFEIFNEQLIYIPVLRTSRMIVGSEKDIYEETVLKQHFSNPTNKLKIETGLQLYKKIGLARNTSREQARAFSEFEKFIGNTFFRGGDIHIVAEQTEKNDQRNIKVTLPGEKDDVLMQDLGDGVQAIINLLFPVFSAQNGAWIFIDEPENHLHPGYQHILVDTLANDSYLGSKKLRYFINTHSNHILSSALMNTQGTEIMVFNRRDKDSSSIQSFNGQEFHTLELLGVLNTSVLTSNSSIWIEGVTDRFYLQAFLYAYLKTLPPNSFKPVEGLHYSFVEYGGKNLLHYEFDHELFPDEKLEIEAKIKAYFINANVFLLADTDFNKSKHLPFENIKRSNFIYFQTELPEIENLLPNDIIKSYFINEVKCKKEEVEKCFYSKANIKLGLRFKGKLTYGKAFRITHGPGGTLSPQYKKGLSNYVHKKIINGSFTWNDLKETHKLKDLTIKLYQFICSKNKLVY